MWLFNLPRSLLNKNNPVSQLVSSILIRQVKHVIIKLHFQTGQ